MHGFRSAVLAAALAFVWVGFAAAAEEPRLLLAISKTDRMLQVRDADSLALRAQVPLGEDPHEIAVSGDLATAYIAAPEGGSGHRIDRVDLGSLTALPPLDTAPLLGPHGLRWQDGKLWFTAQGSKALGRFDLATERLDWAMGTGQDTTHLLHVAPSGERLYATNVGSGTVSLFERRLLPPVMPPSGVMPPNARPRLDWVQTVLPAGAGVEGFDVSPDGSQLWAATPAGTVTVIDPLQGRVTATLETGLLGAHRLAFTPDGHRVLVASVRTGGLAVPDVATRSELARLQSCRGAGIYMDAPADRALISCTPDNAIAILDLATLQEVGRFEIGRPDGVIVVPDRSR